MKTRRNQIFRGALFFYPFTVLLAAILTAPFSHARELNWDAWLDSDWLVSTYQQLHSHPELSYHEKETAAYLAQQLRDAGYEVTEGVAKYANPKRIFYGLVALLKNGEGPTLMLRTDMDGLPVTEATGLPYASRVRTTDAEGKEVGVMHACGHDVHMTSVLGTARLLSRIRDRWRGTLMVIGQPAEERGAGARAFLENGLYERFAKPDFGLALHTNAALEAGKVSYREEYALANVDSVDVTVRGSGGHGAYPHTTKDPVVLAAQLVLALQTISSRETAPWEPVVITVGSIHGGTKHNVIPDEVRLQITVRSYKPEIRTGLVESIRRIAHGIAAAAGIPTGRMPLVEVDDEEETPATYNDPKLTSRVVEVFQQTLGAENVIRMDPVMGGEDFSRYTLEDRSVPTFMFWLGAVERAKMERYQREGRSLPSLHSSQFAPSAPKTLKTGVQALTSAVLHLLKP